MRKQFITHYPANPLVLGKLGSAYGVRGWLKVFSSTEESESIFDYQPWFIKHTAQWQPVELEGWKRHNQYMIIKVKGISDRTSAALLTNFKIVVDSGKLPKLDNGNYYWKDLVGCQVVTTKGYVLGNVINMIETGSNDVLVVKADMEDAFGMTERLVPFLNEQIIKSVDLTIRTIKVDWDPSF